MFIHKSIKRLLKHMKELLRLFELLVQNRPELKEWCDHKKRPWILSGLNATCWQGDPETFLTTQRVSNGVESAHHQSNSLGTGLSFLSAVIR